MPPASPTSRPSCTTWKDAEHEFWRLLGTSVVAADDQGHLSWPRVSCTCNYTGSVKFEDLLDIEMKLERLGEKSITFEYHFRHGEREVAQGRMTAVCCRFPPGEPPKSVPIPPALREQIESYFAEE